MDRRGFLKTLGVAGATAVPGAKALAATDKHPVGEAREFLGMLVDTTLCVGCRKCEAACAEANELPAPDLSDDKALDQPREQEPTQLTIVNRHQVEGGAVNVKRQCMHCAQPACTAACLTRAMLKTKDGPVIWRADKCMGCRFCILSCPFDAPRFQYQGHSPEVRKCQLCWARLRKGQKPACASNCPSGALAFGRRRQLLEVAKTRIYQNPDTYHRQVYGEHEAGGTSIMYLASVPFEKIGFNRHVEASAYPSLTREFLYSVPFVFLLWPAMMLGLNRATQRKAGVARHEAAAPNKSHAPEPKER